MSESPQPSPDPQTPAPRPSQLTTGPGTPALADALRAMGPDYEEALVA